MLKKVLIFGLFVLCLTGCRITEGHIPDIPEVQRKWMTKPDGSRHMVQVAIYIDAENTNPLNAGDYFLKETNGPPYFDIVILGAAQIKRPAGSRFVSLYIPPGLQNVLNNRAALLRPLQNKGIKVLLAITGGNDNVSFGNIVLEEFINDREFDEMLPIKEFSKMVNDFLEMYQLDGVEFIDTNTIKEPASPDTYIYPDATFEGHKIDGQLIVKFPDNPWARVEAWGMHDGGEGNHTSLVVGSKQFCVLTAYLRRYSDYMKDTQRPVIVREINYGAYIVEEPTLFTIRESYVNFHINSEFHSFGVSAPFMICRACGFKLTLRGDWPACPRCMNETLEIDADHPGRSVTPLLKPEHYSPLSIDLNTITPPLYDAGGSDIEGFSKLFVNAPDRYTLMFYNGLVRASVEETDDRFIDTRPGSSGGRLTQADIFSITSEILFGEKVIRTNGDR